MLAVRTSKLLCVLNCRFRCRTCAFLGVRENRFARQSFVLLARKTACQANHYATRSFCSSPDVIRHFLP